MSKDPKILRESSRKHAQQTRIDYQKAHVNDERFDPDPFAQFQRWYEDAIEAGLQEPNAMSLATVNSQGEPSLRMLLMKEFDNEGFIFFTNYNSRKGSDLAQNNHAAMLFYWAVFHRQTRIDGIVTKISAERSDEYFAERPRGAQLSSSVSPQSQAITSREELELRVRELDHLNQGKPLPRPTYWGGYCLKPQRFEFWHGRESRLHDRMEYVLETHGTWKMQRLAP